MKNKTFSVLFYLKRYKVANDGNIPIYARITVDGRRVDISVKRSIQECNWNSDRGKAKGSKQEFTMLNNYLEKLRSKIVESYQDLILQKKMVTADLLKNLFLGIDSDDHTILKMIEYHNEHESDSLEWGTMKNYITTQKYLKAFLKKKYSTNDKYLSELNYQFIKDFESYLRKVKDKHGKPSMANNGVMKHLERLCKMVKLVLRADWISKDPFQAFDLDFVKATREYLTPIELAKIENKTFEIPRLRSIRDLFIFSCYTGLAYIDVFNLKPCHIVEVADNDFWIKTKRQKTNTPVSIPLLPKAMQIIQQYKGHVQADANGRLLPVISNQRVNSYLKEIGDLCGITKPLTFHIARHTFATTVTLTNGVPIESISKMLGHTKLSTTLIYARVIETKLGADMASLKEKLKSGAVKEL